MVPLPVALTTSTQQELTGVIFKKGSVLGREWGGSVHGPLGLRVAVSINTSHRTGSLGSHGMLVMSTHHPYAGVRVTGVGRWEG